MEPNTHDSANSVNVSFISKRLELFNVYCCKVTSGRKKPLERSKKRMYFLIGLGLNSKHSTSTAHILYIVSFDVQIQYDRYI